MGIQFFLPSFKHRSFGSYCSLVIICIIYGCSPPNPHELVSPTTGQIKIMVDENLKDLIEQERQAFEATYKYAKLDIRYLPEVDVLNEFFGDSITVIFTARDLSASELDFFSQKKYFPRRTHFATGALAFIASKNNKDSALTYEVLIAQLKDSTLGKRFVIENARSGISSQMLEILGVDRLPGHFFAQQTKKDVIQYVSSHPDAIGIIDYSDISDSDAAYTRYVLDAVSLLSISRPKDSVQMGYLKPFQYNLQDKLYPFTRKLYSINKTGLNDLGAGFSAYVAGHIGQKIVLKAGLLPEYQSARWIELKSGPNPVVEK